MAVEQVPEITGRVYDKKSAAALGDVIVRWQGTSHSSVTGADGRYVIALQSEYRKLVFSKPGWVDKTIRVRKSGQRDILLKRKTRIPAPLQPEEDLPPGQGFHPDTLN